MRRDLAFEGANGATREHGGFFFPGEFMGKAGRAGRTSAGGVKQSATADIGFVPGGKQDEQSHIFDAIEVVHGRKNVTVTRTRVRRFVGETYRVS